MEIFLTTLYVNATLLGNDVNDINQISAVYTFLKFYCTPIIIAVGSTANVFGLFVVLRSRLRHSTGAVFLGFRFVWDTVFLLSVALMWASLIKPWMAASDWWCLSFTFFADLSTFLSLWLLCGMLLNRSLTVKRPPCLAGSEFLQDVSAWVFVASFTTAAGVVIFLNKSLLSGIVWTEVAPICVPLIQFHSVAETLGKIDIVFNFGVAYFLLLLLLLYCFVHVCRQRPHSADLSAQRETTVTTSSTAPTSPSSDSHLEAEMTQITLSLSLFFLLCNLPCNLLRICVQTLPFMPVQHQRAFVWQQILLFLFICRSAGDSFVCYCCSPLYRSTVIAKLGRRCRSRRYGSGDREMRASDKVTSTDASIEVTHVPLETEGRMCTSAV